MVAMVLLKKRLHVPSETPALRTAVNQISIRADNVCPGNDSWIAGRALPR